MLKRQQKIPVNHHEVFVQPLAAGVDIFYGRRVTSF